MSRLRPVLRWHGGKWRLAPWIVAHMPAHRLYVEPFGGAASVLMHKPRCYGEIFNDLHREVVGLFRVLRDSAQATRLQEALTLTPFARTEFDTAYEAAADPIEQSRRLLVRSFMGFGSTGACLDRRTGFRANSYLSHTTPARDWASYADFLPAFTARLRGVLIESRAALSCMAQHDGPETLHYVDPPYLPETRRITHRGNGYRHELTREDHAALLEELTRLQGMVLLSGYPSPLYTEALRGWHSVTVRAHADGARPRTEVLWLNPAVTERIGRTLALEEPRG